MDACSSYVDRHDLQCITFISDTRLVYYMSFMTPDYQVRSQSISLTLHRVGACSSYVDRHDLQCAILISDKSFVYPYYYLCCRSFCFLLTGCSAIGVIGLSTYTHLRSYMEHLSHTRPPYLCLGLICTLLFSRSSSLLLSPSCAHVHQKHYRLAIYVSYRL